MVNFLSVASGKLIECQSPDIGKLIHRHGGKEIQCQVVNFFVDIHTEYVSLNPTDEEEAKIILNESN